MRVALIWSWMWLALAGCGGDSAVPAPTAAAPTPAPTASPQAITPVAGPARDLPADFNSYNFNLLRVAGETENPSLIAGLTALNAGSLRIPGGTVAEYWDWNRGGIRVAPYPGLPEPDPFNAEIRALSGLTVPVVDRLLDRAGVPAMFTANMLTGTLDENLADVASFRGLGQPIARIELGNEDYFRLPNSTARFPTARTYGDEARSWAMRLRSEAPGARLAVIAPSPLRNTGISFADWMAGLDEANVWTQVDAVAIHPYFDSTALTPLASPDAGQNLIAAMLAHDADYLGQVEARLPLGESIWITEWNVFEDETIPVSGGSWLTAIGNLARAVNFLGNPRVDLSVLHVAVGDRQWSALTSADGRALDYSAGRPLGVSGAPFALTANGEALALFGAALRGQTTAQRLDFGATATTRPLLGTRLSGPGGRVRELLVNGSAAEASIAATGQATLLVAQFDRGIVGSGTLQRSSFAITGGRITLPPFSAALIERQ